MIDYVGLGVVVVVAAIVWRQTIKYREKVVERARKMALDHGYELAGWGQVPEQFREAFQWGMDAGYVKLNPRLASPILWKDHGLYQEAISEFYFKRNNNRVTQAVRIICFLDQDFPRIRIITKSLLPGWGFLRGYKKFEIPETSGPKATHRLEVGEHDRAQNFLSEGLGAKLLEVIGPCELTLRGRYGVFYIPGVGLKSDEMLKKLVTESDPIVKELLKR